MHGALAADNSEEAYTRHLLASPLLPAPAVRFGDAAGVVEGGAAALDESSRAAAGGSERSMVMESLIESGATPAAIEHALRWYAAVYVPAKVAECERELEAALNEGREDVSECIAQYERWSRCAAAVQRARSSRCSSSSSSGSNALGCARPCNHAPCAVSGTDTDWDVVISYMRDHTSYFSWVERCGCGLAVPSPRRLRLHCRPAGLPACLSRLRACVLI